MRLEQTFTVARPPEAVFDYVTEAANLAAWQTSKTSVEQITPGPPGPGTRIRERTKPKVGKEFEQVVEFTGFERPRLLHTHIVEGPLPVDGTWTFEPDGEGTRVHFVADGELHGPMRLAAPVLRRLLDREFAGYHANLRRNLEGG
jgi:carbon monoxide dehydrogenase subunit G